MSTSSESEERVRHAAHAHTMLLSVFEKGMPPQLATGLLLAVDRWHIVVTAGHVLKELRRLGDKGLVQLGASGVQLSIPAHSLWISAHADLGGFPMRPEWLRGVVSYPQTALASGQISMCPVTEGELITYVGFPGVAKMINDRVVSRIGPFEYVTKIRTVEPDQFSALIEADYVVATETSRTDFDLVRDITALGGVSGAPVWSFRGGEPVVVGFVAEGGAWDFPQAKFFFTHASELLKWSDIAPFLPRPPNPGE